MAPVVVLASSAQEPTESTALLGEGSPRSPEAPPFHGTVVGNDLDSARSYDDEETAISKATTMADGKHPKVARIVSILIIAVFVANADGSIVLATHPVISSEFDAMEDSSWLFTAFGLAGAATQALFGKLSDIYGRKPLILLSYVVFTLGTFIVGVGQSMFQVIIGRVISGAVSGGMSVLVSILITDIVPIREVGTWRAYVNIAATTGRALGGPLGGWLVDLVGWRWSFLGQTPFMAVATILCWIYIPSNLGIAKQQGSNPSTTTGDSPSSDGSESEVTDSNKQPSRLSRVDFLGASLLALLILSILLPLEIGGVKIPWEHPVIPTMFGIGGVLVGLFILVESEFAREPILPLEIFLDRDVVSCCVIMFSQVAAQVGLMFSVPLYFKVTARVSNTDAGAHLVPAVAGNAVGGLVAAMLIKRYGRYKWITLAASITSAISYILLLLLWHGHTNWAESLYIVPGGLGTGIAQTAVFVALQAVANPENLAPSISTLYLCTGVGAIVGTACMSAVHQTALRKELEARLLQLGLDATQRSEIISKAVSNVDYSYKVGGRVSEAIVASYVKGLWSSHIVSLAFSLLSFLTAIPLRERKL